MKQIVLSCCFLLLGHLPIKCGAHCKGCTVLDSLTFDRIVNKFTTTLVKFDDFLAPVTSPEYRAYSQISLDLAKFDDLLIGEVQLKDYAEKDGHDLAVRYHINKKYYSPSRERPSLMLFRQDRSMEGKLQAHKFPEKENYTVDGIKHFVRLKTGLPITLAGCIRTFDILAQRFLGATDAGEKVKAMGSAENALQKMSETKGKEYLKAKTYVKIMRKTLKEGDAFIKAELHRVRKLLAKGQKSLSHKKKLQLEHQINILRSFIVDVDKML